MRVIIDIEANGLDAPDKIWVIVCKDIDTGQLHIFRKPTEDPHEKRRFIQFDKHVELYIGHHILGYDLRHCNRLLNCPAMGYWDRSIDTLVVSKLNNYSRDGHSLQEYGYDLGLDKKDFTDFSKYSKALEEYCIRDVEVNERIYTYLRTYIDKENNLKAIRTEQMFQSLGVNTLEDNGFYFDKDKAEALRLTVTNELNELDERLLIEFPPKEVTIREFVPKATKFGTINKSTIPKALRENICNYNIGDTYKYTKSVPFNPSSHKQVIDVLHEAGWKPVNKTKTHLELERELNRLSWSNLSAEALALRKQECYAKGQSLSRYGWKIDETNLSTLPPDAPSSAKTLARRILVESRRRTLTEWLSLVSAPTEGSRIHGKFYGIGAWTHRMAHQNPNTANIPTDVKLFGKEMRSLWCVPEDRLLVGVDAEGIQLRIFAHYIDDPEFTQALVSGKKEDKSDPHSVNQRILGPSCASRQIAKRFIYALLLGAGLGKLAEILSVSKDEAKVCLDRLMERYTGFAYVKNTLIPADAERGWFVGLDGRAVPIPGQDAGKRRHLCMSGYLQNGEAIAMKMAYLHWYDQLTREGIDFKPVNFVHDEWQTEVPNDMDIALHVAKVQADSLRQVGEELGLKCPLAGSYWNDDHKCYTIGKNWSVTH